MRGFPAAVLIRRDLDVDSGGVARSGFHAERAADHFDAFPHADESQTVVIFRVGFSVRIKALSVILDVHVDDALKALDAHLHLTGLGMAGDIGKRLLGDPVEHGARRTVGFLDTGEHLEADANAGILHEALHERLEGRDQAQVIEHGRAQLACEAVHDVHGFFHQPLGAGDLFVQCCDAACGLCFEGGEPHVDTRKRLGDYIMQLAADLAALLLLHGQQLARQMEQLLLHLP